MLKEIHLAGSVRTPLGGFWGASAAAEWESQWPLN
jgi:hypothetical protein